MSSPKLYELLSVAERVKKTSNVLITGAIATFKNKENLFKGEVRRLVMFGKDDTNRVEYEAMEAKEAKNVRVTATIPENLNYAANGFANLIDLTFQVEKSNQTALADVIVDDKVLVSAAPATFLLGMETKLEELRKLIVEAPTLPPGIVWQPDTTYGNSYVYASPTTTDMKVKVSEETVVTVPPTPQHPAQTTKIQSRTNIGKYEDTSYSGMVSSSDKAALLTRLENLLTAVKTARQRANAVDANTEKHGNDMMAYVFGAWFNPETVNTGSTT